MGSSVPAYLESLEPEDSKDEPLDSNKNQQNEPDYYWENGFIVFTASYLKQRGWCCGNGCRHCPFEPKHQKGNRNLPRVNPEV